MEPVRCANCQSLQQRAHDLQAENEQLRRQLDAALRAGKRQAGPFAKDAPQANPKKPGRKSGKDYGTKGHRQPPQPDQIDETLEAPSRRLPRLRRAAGRDSHYQAIPG
jgi:hypothetical protein